MSLREFLPCSCPSLASESMTSRLSLHCPSSLGPWPFVTLPTLIGSRVCWQMLSSTGRSGVDVMNILASHKLSCAKRVLRRELRAHLTTLCTPRHVNARVGYKPRPFPRNLTGPHSGNLRAERWWHRKLAPHTSCLEQKPTSELTSLPAALRQLCLPWMSCFHPQQTLQSRLLLTLMPLCVPKLPAMKPR